MIDFTKMINLYKINHLFDLSGNIDSTDRLIV